MEFLESDYVKNNILNYNIRRDDKWNTLAIMIGVNHPCYKFVKLFAGMNKKNYKKNKMEE